MKWKLRLSLHQILSSGTLQKSRDSNDTSVKTFGGPPQEYAHDNVDPPALVNSLPLIPNKLGSKSLFPNTMTNKSLELKANTRSNKQYVPPHSGTARQLNGEPLSRGFGVTPLLHNNNHRLRKLHWDISYRHYMSSVEHTDNEEKQQTPNQWTRVLAVLTSRNSSIELLSKELDILKRRCNNAKSMTDQLRSDRDTLQTRLMRNLAEYSLSEPRSKVVCQQVKLLGELDQSLDEWADTWRELELQRSQVERLLLHHISTVLMESQI